MVHLVQVTSAVEAASQQVLSSLSQVRRCSLTSAVTASTVQRMKRALVAATPAYSEVQRRSLSQAAAVLLRSVQLVVLEVVRLAAQARRMVVLVEVVAARRRPAVHLAQGTLVTALQARA